MPLRMSGHIQSVVVLGRMYVGGGNAGYKSRDNYIVMEYDISSGKWAKLSPYRAEGFAMAVINNQLVLVGGKKSKNYSKVLGVWRAETQEWTQMFPEMSTARSSCSAVVYTEWLVVAGGLGDGMVKLLSVDVMNTGTKQWHAGPSMPTSWSRMKTARVGDTCFFMGGSIAENHQPATEVCSVSLPALISQLCSLESRGQNKQQIWKEIPGLQTVQSSPLSISGCLLAVGGESKGIDAATIMLYKPDTGKWVKVGDHHHHHQNLANAINILTNLSSSFLPTLSLSHDLHFFTLQPRLLLSD